MGHAGLQKFCGMMNLTPPVEKSSHNDINKFLHKTFNELAEKYLNDAAQRLILHTMAGNPGNIEVTDKDKLITKVGVTVDGTWQKRHSSKMGVVFVISIDTGEVLDYDVRSLFCHECTSNYARKSKDDFDNWYNQHKIHCQINHTGSADKWNQKGQKVYSFDH